MRTFVAELAVLLHGVELFRGSVGVVSPRHVAVRSMAGEAGAEARSESTARVVLLPAVDRCRCGDQYQMYRRALSCVTFGGTNHQWVLRVMHLAAPACENAKTSHPNM